jgi:hypothetical protein
MDGSDLLLNTLSIKDFVNVTFGCKNNKNIRGIPDSLTVMAMSLRR